MTVTFEKKHTGAEKESPFKFPTFPTMASCSAHCGIPLTLLKTAKSAGCDAFSRRNDVDLGRLLRWLFAEENEAKPVDWKKRREAALAQREELRLARDQGRSLDRGEVERVAADAEGWHYDNWDRLQREMPTALAGLGALEIHNRLEPFINNVKKQSREKFSAVAANGKE